MDYYLILLKEYYNCNLVKLNCDKYQFMLSGKPKLIEKLKNITLIADDNNIIRQTFSIIILGSILTPDFSQEREICAFIPPLNNRINQFEKLAKFTDFKTRLQFLNAYVQGRISYMLATYSNINNDQIHKIHKIVMRAARMCLQSYCFKQSIKSILDRCKWVDVKESIIISTLKEIGIDSQNQPIK